MPIAIKDTGWWFWKGWRFLKGTFEHAKNGDGSILFFLGRENWFEIGEKWPCTAYLKGRELPLENDNLPLKITTP